MFYDTLMWLSRPDIQSQFDTLLSQPCDTLEQLLSFIATTDRLDGELSKTYARHYIYTTTNTADQQSKQAHDTFLQEVYPVWITYSDRIHRHILSSPVLDQLPDQYHNFIREIRHTTALFREENIPLMTKDRELSSQFAEVMGSLTVIYRWKELTIKQAEEYLKSNDRIVRKEIFELIEARRYQEHERMDQLMTKLISVRTQIAQHCGFASYTDYSYSSRFDYTKEQINEFHRSIATVVSPLLQNFLETRKQKLWLDHLFPYDMVVPLEEAETELFESTQHMIDHLLAVLEDMDPMMANHIRHLQSNKYLDLETRPQKAPGWYNYPLSNSRDSFIFMNALRDSDGRFTWAHETGHALHHYLTWWYALNLMRNCPSEICEIASMSMELFTLPYLSQLWWSPQAIRNALREKIEHDISFLPYMSKIDLFQQWMYDHPNHTVIQRHAQRRELNKQYPLSLRIWSYESRDAVWYHQYLDTFWHRQMHIFEVPFYYIDYGIAYLASIQLFQQYLTDPKKAISNYKNILSDWYIRSIPDTMNIGQVKFNLSQEKLLELLSIIYGQLQ